MRKKLENGLKSLATPLVREFPFIVVFIILMGLKDALYDAASLFYNYGFDAWAFIMKDVKSFFIWFMVAYILAAIMTKWNRWWVRIPIYVISFSFFAIQFFLKDNFSLPISPAYLMLVAETNGKESGEFLNEYVFSNHIIKTMIWVVALIVLLYVSRRYWKKLLGRLDTRFNKRKSTIKLGLGALLIPALLYGMDSSQVYIRMAQCHDLENLRHMSRPNDPLTCTYFSSLFLNRLGESMGHAKEVGLSQMRSSRLDNATDSLNVVVVVGESFIKHHAQLYGYYLNTTPKMMEEQKAGRLFVFSDVVTPNNVTSEVLKNMLSCNNLVDREPWYDFPFFPADFRGAGYDVYFWDNQRTFNEHSDYTFALNSFLFSKEFEDSVYVATNHESFPYDGELLNSFAENVKLSSSHNLVFFHLMGQHFISNRRFPQTKENLYFTADSIRNTHPFLTPAKKQLIADYDNATRYNDEVMGQIFRMFAQTNSLVIYFSDHGEEVYDYRDSSGRDHGALSENKARYEYEVPFVIWCSDKFMSSHTDIVNAIKEAVDKPFMLDNLCHMLFHIGGVSTPDYREKHDLLSPAYQCTSRLLEGYWDYDSHF